MNLNCIIVFYENHIKCITEIQMCCMEPFCCGVLRSALHYVVLILVCCVALCRAVLCCIATSNSVWHWVLRCHLYSCTDFSAALSCAPHCVSVIDITWCTTRRWTWPPIVRCSTSTPTRPSTPSATPHSRSSECSVSCNSHPPQPGPVDHIKLRAFRVWRDGELRVINCQPVGECTTFEMYPEHCSCNWTRERYITGTRGQRWPWCYLIG